MNCRFCGADVKSRVLSLGASPLANSFLTGDQLGEMEPFYPLEVFICGACHLVQLREYESPEHIFGDYAYFSSWSDTWQKHVASYAEKMTAALGLGGGSLVVEIASNDGCLLRNFSDKGIDVLGIEPAANVAQTAVANGVPTEVSFFGTKTAGRLAGEGRRADLLVGNNVLAHVPDLNDFVAGMKILLAPGGTVTMEFPWLVRLIEGRQFDTIYHEHFSYFTFAVAKKVFSAHGLAIFDVEELPIHGGSLRIFARHEEEGGEETARAAALAAGEADAGFGGLERYAAFQDEVDRTKRAILSFLIGAKEKGRKVAAYGAPAKGNTLLNYCGVGTDLIDFTVDRSHHKQGLYLPGSRIPVAEPGRIKEARPDYLFILPWNIRDEVMAQTAYIRDWGGRFVIPIPEVQVL